MTGNRHTVNNITMFILPQDTIAQFDVAEVNQLIPPSGQFTIPADPNRVALILATSAASIATFGDPGNLAGGCGISIPTGGQPLLLSHVLYGPIVSQQMQIAGPAGTATTYWYASLRRQPSAMVGK